ncbi:MAG TPA: hypothetical protein VME70_11230 [Mycobacteriales bacterium]|nr:hypothetical protein [Mycobacteriales bacterium]
MGNKKMFLSLISWAAFTILADHGGTGFVPVAAAIAGLIALAITIFNTRGSKLKLIDATGVVTFAAMTAIAFVGDDAVRRHIVDYGRGGCALVLGLVMLASLAFTPFTEQYAREATPRQYWTSPIFHAVNRKLTAVWAAAIIVMSGGHFLSGYLQAAGELHRRTNLALNWVLPVVLVLFALKQTSRITSSDDAPAAPTVTA